MANFQTKNVAGTSKKIKLGIFSTLLTMLLPVFACDQQEDKVKTLLALIYAGENSMPAAPAITAKTNYYDQVVNENEWQITKSINFKWQDPVADTAILGYQYKIDTVNDWLDTDYLDSQKITFFNNGKYTFHLRARNKYGWGKEDTFNCWVAYPCGTEGCLEYPNIQDENSYIQNDALAINGTPQDLYNKTGLTAYANNGKITVTGTLNDCSWFDWTVTDPCSEQAERVLSINVTQADGFTGWGGGGMFELDVVDQANYVHALTPDPDYAVFRSQYYLKNKTGIIKFQLPKNITHFRLKNWAGTNIQLTIEDIKVVTK